jgi:muramidase (phage lysozyme)
MTNFDYLTRPLLSRQLMALDATDKTLEQLLAGVNIEAGLRMPSGIPPMRSPIMAPPTAEAFAALATAPRMTAFPGGSLARTAPTFEQLGAGLGFPPSVAGPTPTIGYPPHRGLGSLPDEPLVFPRPENFPPPESYEEQQRARGPLTFDPSLGAPPPSGVTEPLRFPVPSSAAPKTSPRPRARPARGAVDEIVNPDDQTANPRVTGRPRTQTPPSDDQTANPRVTGPPFRQTSPYRGGIATDPVNLSIPPVGRALLNAIARGESAGRYDIRYSPRGGVPFDLSTGQHPRIFEPSPHGRSSAAGRYQFTWSTWRDFAGANTPFTPENQDRYAWALAQRTYRNNTGRDLATDLEQQGFTPRIAQALAPTWHALNVNFEKNKQAFDSSYARYRSGGGGAPQGPPEPFMNFQQGSGAQQEPFMNYQPGSGGAGGGGAAGGGGFGGGNVSYAGGATGPGSNYAAGQPEAALAQILQNAEMPRLMTNAERFSRANFDLGNFLTGLGVGFSQLSVGAPADLGQVAARQAEQRQLAVEYRLEQRRREAAATLAYERGDPDAAQAIAGGAMSMREYLTDRQLRDVEARLARQEMRDEEGRQAWGAYIDSLPNMTPEQRAAARTNPAAYLTFEQLRAGNAQAEQARLALEQQAAERADFILRGRSGNDPVMKAAADLLAADSNMSVKDAVETAIKLAGPERLTGPDREIEARVRYFGETPEQAAQVVLNNRVTPQGVIQIGGPNAGNFVTPRSVGPDEPVPYDLTGQSLFNRAPMITGVVARAADAARSSVGQVWELLGGEPIAPEQARAAQEFAIFRNKAIATFRNAPRLLAQELELLLDDVAPNKTATMSPGTLEIKLQEIDRYLRREEEIARARSKDPGLTLDQRNEEAALARDIRDTLMLLHAPPPQFDASGQRVNQTGAAPGAGSGQPQGPVVVSSVEEALKLPPGTVVILNGQYFVVEG